MIKYDPRNCYFKSRFGAIEKNEIITFRIQISRRICAFSVSLVFEGDAKYVYPLKFSSCKGSFEEYKENIKIDREGLYFYWFEITDTRGKLIKVGKNNIPSSNDDFDFSPWKLTVYINSFTGIEHFYGRNIYQIFPDRFCKVGDIDRSKHNNIKPWGEIPNHIRDEDGTLDTSDFFGGNFKGIESKLGYLHNLGVGVIYLNPIFESASNHRYDTGDYEKPDSLLGSLDDFKSLCKKASEFDIEIILDGVFSHTGADSRYFNKYGSYNSVGAYQSEQSEYYPWFRFRQWPDDYDCWWNVKILPNTNETEPTFLKYIVGENGIARKWIRYGASGWRLDVADELPDEFLEKFRNAVKDEKSDAVIIGEVWENAADKISYGNRRRYLHGNQLDSVMNYVFRNAVIDFVKNKSAVKFTKTVLEICEEYPAPILNCLMNFLGTHDTERIKTVLGSEKLTCLAYAILAFLPGLPTIYYGDEAGMEGGKDPLNRLCYPWGQENNEMIAFFSEINRIRLGIECLKIGRFLPLWADDGFLIFSRESENEKCIFAVNISDSPKILPSVFEEGIDLYSKRTIAPGSILNSQDFLIICMQSTHNQH